MHICLRFYNLNIKDQCFSGCTQFDVELFRVIPLGPIKLGCFNFGGSQSFGTKLRNTLNFLEGKSKYQDRPRITLLPTNTDTYERVEYVSLLLCLTLLVCSIVYIFYKKCNSRSKNIWILRNTQHSFYGTI